MKKLSRETLDDLLERGLLNKWERFWQELTGTTIIHQSHGDCVVLAADELRVTLQIDGEPRTFKASLLHQFVEFPLPVPPGHCTALLADKLRVLAKLEKKHEGWEVNWAKIGDAERKAVIGLLNMLSNGRGKLSISTLQACRTFELDWLPAIYYSRIYADTGDPWAAIQSSSWWRKIGQPRDALIAVTPILKSERPIANDVRSAALTTKAAALCDLGELEGALETAMSALSASEHKAAHLAAMRVCAQMMDFDRMERHRNRAVELGASDKEVGLGQPTRQRAMLKRLTAQAPRLV